MITPRLIRWKQERRQRNASPSDKACNSGTLRSQFQADQAQPCFHSMKSYFSRSQTAVVAQHSRRVQAVASQSEEPCLAGEDPGNHVVDQVGTTVLVASICDIVDDLVQPVFPVFAFLHSTLRCGALGLAQGT